MNDHIVAVIILSLGISDAAFEVSACGDGIVDRT